MNADALRVILIIFLMTIFLVAVFYLRRRRMSKLAYAFWGIFALLLPAFGPFFVIAYSPGKLTHRKGGRRKSAMKRKGDTLPPISPARPATPGNKLGDS